MNADRDNWPTNIWDEKLWSFGNLKAAKENRIFSASELNRKAAEIIGLSEIQLQEKADNQKLRFVVVSEWSRTELKNRGLILNQKKGSGIWKLTTAGEQVDCSSYDAFLYSYNRSKNLQKMRYISQDEISNALLKATFKEDLPKGNATKHTSLIFQTLAYFAALTSKGTDSLQIAPRTEGRKLLVAEYSNLVGTKSRKSKRCSLSALGIQNKCGFEINPKKDANGTLSSNFFSNVAGRNTEYADFVYNEAQDQLTIKPELEAFKSAIRELTQVGFNSLIILALRSVEIQANVLPFQVNEEILRRKFGAAGELLWTQVRPEELILIESTDDHIATLEETHLANTVSHWEREIDQRLAYSLASKQYVVLAGGTGTGKTRAAIILASSVAGKENIQVVAVGADWTDNRPLLGFRNLLAEDGKTYVAPPALRIILKALDNPGNPYFLILDEMNLSHVERYFADFLSSMESKEKLKLHDCAEALRTEDGISVEGKVAWPSNLFVIGTVNIDETTYMFSPKVLDRAHVIEFKVAWEEIEGGLEGAVPGELLPLSAEQVQEFMRVAQFKDKALSEDDHESLIEVLRDMHKALDGSRFVFAHRTARECLNFIASAQALAKADIVPPQDIKDLIDLAILQKALPKLNGAAGTLSKVLEDLIKVSDMHDLTLCKEKLESMSRQLKADQFVSFIQ